MPVFLRLMKSTESPYHFMAVRQKVHTCNLFCHMTHPTDLSTISYCLAAVNNNLVNHSGTFLASPLVAFIPVAYRLSGVAIFHAG